MRGFLAIIFNMGLINLPQVEDYWKRSWLTEVPFFSRVMPRDRFELLFWLFHVSHPTSATASRIDKIKMLLDKMLARFQACYYPGREFTLDETMVGFRGKFVAKQYIQNKPTKWGIKCFTLADSSNGYVLNVLVYTGRETLQEADSNSQLPQPARVVMHLAQPYLHCGHHLFTDRYYSSLPLAQSLHAADTEFTGTIMKNRADLPGEFRSQMQIGSGDITAYRADFLLALAWLAEKKKKPVMMISTSSSAALTTVPSQNPHVPPQEKPVVVDSYNQYMNGVDIADQYAVYYSFVRKTVKWWRKVAFWLLGTAMVNSYVLYKESTRTPMSHVAYRRSVIEALASAHISTAPPRLVGRPRKRPRVSEAGPERLNKRLHLLGTRTQRQCVVCHAAERKTRPVYYCKTCPDMPQLCPTECFERYHTLPNF